MASTTSRVERTRRNPEEVVANLVEGYVSNVCLHDACMYVTCPLHNGSAVNLSILTLLRIISVTSLDKWAYYTVT